MDIETVEIVNPAAKSGFTRINKADFAPDQHQLWLPPEVRAAEEAAKAEEARMKAEADAKAAEEAAKAQATAKGAKG
jgi:hypothetical protein